MTKGLRDYLELAIFFVVLGAILAGVWAIGSGKAFGPALVYAVVGLTTAVGSVVATIMLFCEIGRRRGIGESTGLLLAGWVTGLFVTAPICLKLLV
jgi:hypothetical protein